jgi:hypothetical protein
MKAVARVLGIHLFMQQQREERIIGAMLFADERHRVVIRTCLYRVKGLSVNAFCFACDAGGNSTAGASNGRTLPLQTVNHVHVLTLEKLFL